jgi:hypothetical protein
MGCVAIAGFALTSSAMILQSTAAQADGVVRNVTPSDAQKAVNSAAPNDVIVLGNGVYGNLLLKDLAKTNVTIKGASRTGVTLQGLQILNSSGVTISDLSVTSNPTYKASAVRLQGTTNNINLARLNVQQTYAKGIDITGTTNHISIADNVLDGSLVTTGNVGRGIYIEGAGASTNWPSFIDIRRNDIARNNVDNVFIAGATNVTIADNRLHDLQANDLHNDGVQVTAGARIEITRNLFVNPGTTSEPDQGIILGADNADRPITDVLISNNVIRDWRGTGIIVSGAANVRIVNNSIARTGAPNYKAASILSVESAFPNPGMAVWNNMIESLNTAQGTISYEDFNCVATGGRGAKDVKADPQVADQNTLKPAAGSPCIGAGTNRTDTPAVDFGSQTRTGAVTAGAWTA